MSDDEFRFLSIRHLPARLTVEETAWLLRCQPHDIQGLVRARLLKPLGNPPANGKKLYWTKDVLALAGDETWLNRMTNTIHTQWRQNNTARKGSSPGPAVDDEAA